MDWESYFAELEGQFADDAAAEQAAVAQENERLRQARLDLLTRLRSAAAEHATIAIATAGPHQISGTIQATGADWCGIDTATSAMRCVRLDAMRSIRLSSLALRRSLMTVPPDALQGRAKIDDDRTVVEQPGRGVKLLVQRRKPLREGGFRGQDQGHDAAPAHPDLRQGERVGVHVARPAIRCELSICAAMTPPSGLGGLGSRSGRSLRRKF